MTYHREQELIAMVEYTNSPVSIHEEETCIKSIGESLTHAELVDIFMSNAAISYRECNKIIDALIACGALKVRV